MPAGRPPKPAALRILEGKRGHRPIPEEPAVDDAMPERPKWLMAEARRTWDRLAPKLHAAGLLKSVDGDALAAYCQLYAQWRQLDRVCAKGCTAPTVNSKGALVTAVRPEFVAAQKCLDQMQKLMQKFGLSPQARTGLAAGKASAAADPFSAAMGA